MIILTRLRNTSSSDVVKANTKTKASTLKAKTTAQAWTFEAKDKAIGPEAKVFKHTAWAEIKIRAVSLTAW